MTLSFPKGERGVAIFKHPYDAYGWLGSEWEEGRAVYGIIPSRYIRIDVNRVYKPSHPERIITPPVNAEEARMGKRWE